MKNILLLAHDDAGQESRLQAALDLARGLQGHLICLDVVQPPAMAGDYFGAAEGPLLDAERERESENRARLAARLAGEDVPWEMREATGEIPDCLAHEAGLADVIVISRRLDDQYSPDMRAVATSTVLRSRKPVVAVSEDCRGFDARGSALVAWNGSQPAMNALLASVPLLAMAASVTLFQVEDGVYQTPAEEAASYLSRHAIHAMVRRVDNRTTPPAELIRSACEEIGAAYCVMGAYGHSPLRETLFGGVTREMLGSSRIPLVIAH